MAATWYLIKYMHDPRRQEPRNVGLALQYGDQWVTKFVGETTNGSIDGRSVKSYQFDLEVYNNWVSYFRRKTASAGWGDVDRLNRRGHRSNFYAELAGHASTPELPIGELLDELFGDLVESLTSVDSAALERPSHQLTAQVKNVLRRAQIAAVPKYTVDARYTAGGRLSKVSFDYAYRNGQLHLMEELSVGRSPKKAEIKARELRTRMEAARRAGSGQSFLVFYSGSGAQGDSLDEVLLPLEGEARSIDVDATDEAVNSIRTIMGH